MRPFLFLILALCCSAASGQAPAMPFRPDSTLVTAPADTINPYATAQLSQLLIHAPEQTYGYMIFINGDLVVEQTSMPGLPGKKGFERPEDAAKVAALVIHKIRKNEMPPSVTADEIKNLGIKIPAH